MTTTIERMGNMLELLARDVLRTVEGLPEDVLNREVDVPEANSLFAIATHALASTKVWTLTAVGGQQIPRDRDSEFVATGTYDDLREAYETWIAEMHGVLDGVPDSELGRDTGIEPYRDDLFFNEPGTETMTIAHALAHGIDHLAIHLGHMQVTKDAILGGTL